MHSLDTITLDALRATLQGIGLTTDPLVAWWQSTAAAGESLLDFLLHEGILPDDAKKTFQMIQKGYLNLDGLSLIKPASAQLLKAKLLSGSTPMPVKISALNKSILVTQTNPAGRTIPDAPKTQQFGTLPSVVVPFDATAELDTVQPLRIGDRVGRCLLTRLLGSGGGGIVYEAMHQSLGIPVAVKMLPPGMTTPTVLKTMTQEARTLAQLQHPNVIRVLDFDPDAPNPYFVMELVSGFSLAELIQQSGWLRTEQAINIIAQTACGLDAGYRAGIVHRDVKPANILIDRSGAVKLADLGLAAPAEQPAGKGSDSNLKHKACGTVAYMAPERFQSRKPADARSDIYSLGVTLYEALTGILPFEGDNGFELMVQHASAPIPDPRRINPLVPASVSGLVERMMAKDPADRFPGYDLLMEELRHYTTTPPLMGDASTRRNSWSMTSDPASGQYPAVHQKLELVGK